MSNIMYHDMSIEKMVLKNAMEHRLVEMREHFDQDTVYKTIYLLEKIERLDDKRNIPMKKREPIYIRVNSPGGMCYSLWSLIDKIEEMKKKGYEINTIAIGIAMSCGFVLFCAGQKRIAYRNATLLYHCVSSGTYGKLADMQDDLAEAERLNKMSRDYILKHTNLTKELLDDADYRRRDWYISAEEALKHNVATEIRG